MVEGEEAVVVVVVVDEEEEVDEKEEVDVEKQQRQGLKKKEEGPHEPEIKWFPGSVPLGLEEDKYWLSELQCYLRSNFAEVFAATEDDIAAPMH